MTGRDTPAMDQSRNGIREQMALAIRDAVTGPRVLGVLFSLALVVLAGLLAPGEGPGVWTWARVLLAWLLAAVALSTIAGTPFENGQVAPISPLVVWGSLLLAVVVSLTFTTLAATLAVIILLLLLFNLRTGGALQPASFWLFATTLTPLWVWSAFEAWNQWLLMLIPIGAVGLLALEHAIRAGHVDNGLAERLAGWIAIIGLSAMLLTVATLSGIPPGWVATGAIAAALLAALDVVVMPAIERNPLPTVTLPVFSLLALAFGWLVAL
jgi:hypothetical protein